MVASSARREMATKAVAHDAISIHLACRVFKASDGGLVRLFNVFDDFNREALSIEVDFSLPARVLNGRWSR